jgi:hypothetical protein
MAPEQARDEESGPPADLWALGASLYHAVEGAPPFDRGQAIPTLTAVVYDDPRPPQRAGSLKPVLIALLSKSPAARPTAPELRRRLEEIVSPESPREDRPAPATTPLRAPSPEPEAAAVPAASAPEPRPGRRWVALAAALLALGLGAALFLPGLLDEGDGGSDGRPRAARQERGTGGGAGEAQADAQDAAAGSDAPASGGLPAEQDPTGTVPTDWTVFTDPVSGFSIAHPPDWEVIEAPADSDSVDFRDPASGTYMRVDWTDTPGDDPEQAWRDFAPDFAASHENYEEIQITPTTFQGYTAAIWEFTYSEGGTDLHAVDLGFVTGDYGFALNFQTHAENWDASQDIFEAFKASFQAPT